MIINKPFEKKIKTINNKQDNLFNKTNNINNKDLKIIKSILYKDTEYQASSIKNNIKKNYK